MYFFKWIGSSFSGSPPPSLCLQPFLHRDPVSAPHWQRANNPPSVNLMLFTQIRAASVCHFTQRAWVVNSNETSPVCGLTASASFVKKLPDMHHRQFNKWFNCIKTVCMFHFNNFFSCLFLFWAPDFAEPPFWKFPVCVCVCMCVWRCFYELQILYTVFTNLNFYFEFVWLDPSWSHELTFPHGPVQSIKIDQSNSSFPVKLTLVYWIPMENSLISCSIMVLIWCI